MQKRSNECSQARMSYVLANNCTLQNSKYKNVTVSLNDVTNQAAGRSHIRERSRIYYFHIICNIKSQTTVVPLLNAGITGNRKLYGSSTKEVLIEKPSTSSAE
jgi:hypothetical protein